MVVGVYRGISRCRGHKLEALTLAQRRNNKTCTSGMGSMWGRVAKTSGSAK